MRGRLKINWKIATLVMFVIVVVSSTLIAVNVSNDCTILNVDVLRDPTYVRESCGNSGVVDERLPDTIIENPSEVKRLHNQD